MINVLIADDHAIVRGGLKQLFSMMGDITVTGEATDGLGVLDMLEQGESFDLLLLDLTMPGINGINLINRIRVLTKTLPILVLSMHNEWQVARRVFRAGVSGFVTKGSPQDMLMTAVRKVAAGGRFVDPMLVEQMVFEKPAVEEDASLEKLSERELLILKLIVKGKTVNAIATELFISNKTVSTHKTRLMRKMNFQNNADLMRYGIEHALIE